jgi:bifunctional non-homologous end joining protein LigD
MGRKGSRQAFLYAFDLLEPDGLDLRREPWETRRATLASPMRTAADGLQLSEHIEGTDGFTIFGHACRMGLEGIAGIDPTALAGARIGSREESGRAGCDAID